MRSSSSLIFIDLLPFLKVRALKRNNTNANVRRNNSYERHNSNERPVSEGASSFEEGMVIMDAKKEQADLEKENSELKKEVRELKQLLTEERDLRNAVAGNTSLSGETDTNGSSQGSSRHGQVKFKEEQNGIAKSTPNDGVVGDARGNDGINNVSLCNGMEKKSEISWSKILNPDG